MLHSVSLQRALWSLGRQTHVITHIFCNINIPQGYERLIKNNIIIINTSEHNQAHWNVAINKMYQESDLILAHFWVFLSLWMWKKLILSRKIRYKSAICFLMESIMSQFIHDIVSLTWLNAKYMYSIKWFNLAANWN